MEREGGRGFPPDGPGVRNVLSRLARLGEDEATADMTVAEAAGFLEGYFHASAVLSEALEAVEGILPDPERRLALFPDAAARGWVRLAYAEPEAAGAGGCGEPSARPVVCSAALAADHMEWLAARRAYEDDRDGCAPRVLGGDVRAGASKPPALLLEEEAAIVVRSHAGCVENGFLYPRCPDLSPFASALFATDIPVVRADAGRRELVSAADAIFRGMAEAGCSECGRPVLSNAFAAQAADMAADAAAHYVLGDLDPETHIFGAILHGMVEPHAAGWFLEDGRFATDDALNRPLRSCIMQRVAALCLIAAEPLFMEAIMARACRRESLLEPLGARSARAAAARTL